VAVVVGGWFTAVVVDGFVGAVRRSLIGVRDLFGAPGLVAGVSVSGSGVDRSVGDWSGLAADRQASAASSLDARSQDLRSADQDLDRWTSSVNTDTTAGRHSASNLVRSADYTTQVLGPYRNTVPGRVALVSSLGDHIGAAADLVSSYSANIPQRRLQLAALTAQYKPTTTPPPRHHHKHKHHHNALHTTNNPPPTTTQPTTFGSWGSSGAGSTGALWALRGGSLPQLPPRLAGDGSLGSAAVNAAAEKLGTIYKWGGKGGPADGGRVDCSGLMHWAYAKLGIDIGPDTYTQVTKGVQVSPNDIRPGDLVFCHFGGKGPGHVVMATGDGPQSRIIEASHDGAPVAFGPMPAGRVIVKRIVP
jgi:cell wall-associated NlpC family hydrolase